MDLSSLTKTEVGMIIHGIQSRGPCLNGHGSLIVGKHAPDLNAALKCPLCHAIKDIGPRATIEP